jgi:hypothetical protein
VRIREGEEIERTMRRKRTRGGMRGKDKRRRRDRREVDQRKDIGRANAQKEID